MDLADKINWEKRKVLVVGEASIDKYIFGSATSISPDAPVPNVKIDQNSNYIGGIGLAVQFIKSLGGIPEVCTVLGNDFEGDFFLKRIKQLNINTSGIIMDEDIYTPQITRIKAMNQQLLRLETDYSVEISESTIEKFLKVIKSRSQDYESILILNYGIGGLFNEHFTQKLLIELKENYKDIPIIARPHPSNYYIYEDVDLMKINLQKALQLFSIDCCNETSVSIVAKKILNSAKCKNVLLSYIDSESFLMTSTSEKLLKIPSIVQEPVRSYVAVGSVIMAILCLTYASDMPVFDGVKTALYGAALSAVLPPVEFFDSRKLRNFIESFSNKE